MHCYKTRLCWENQPRLTKLTKARVAFQKQSRDQFPSQTRLLIFGAVRDCCVLCDHSVACSKIVVPPRLQFTHTISLELPLISSSPLSHLVSLCCRGGNLRRLERPVAIMNSRGALAEAAARFVPLASQKHEPVRAAMMF